jgi:muramoyltetrapeptide carboxypeptidase
MLIDIISPAGAHTDLPRFDKACACLRGLGYDLNVMAPREGWQRFGGDDEARLESIHRAARSSSEAVMLTRGGYGLSRLMDRIDWALVAASVAGGKKWIGFSDFSIFQSALFAKTGAHSFAGPSVTEDFGGEALNELMLISFKALLRGVTPVVQWNAAAPASLDAPDAQGMLDRKQALPKPLTAVLWGGNLAMIGNLVGTPYLPSDPKLGLLWLEDIAEHPYRVERLLHQLFYAGVLQRQKAILFGSFSHWKPAPHDHGYGWDAMLDYFRDRLQKACGDAAPVLVEGLPFGHQALKTILEYGRRYRLSLDEAATYSLEPL